MAKTSNKTQWRIL